MKRTHDGPASNVIRKPGTHQVESKTPNRAAKPSKEVHGPGGAKRKMVLWEREAARRKARWVIRIIIQIKGPPKKATPIMNRKAVLLNN